MRILGIETSCDETSAAVVENGRKILSNVVLSQESVHRRFKGIVPEIASRSHLVVINGIIEKALRNADSRQSLRNSKKMNCSVSLQSYKSGQVDAIAVTVGPGLVGSLLVGKMTAEALCLVWNKPLIGINHLEAHLFSSLFEEKKLAPPFIGLIVSGGHTDLVLVEEFGKYIVLGRTRDDAAGESFDKVANILNLGYPGGPLVDRMAKEGNPKSIAFPRPYLWGSWDFSFSGLKTAVLYLLQKTNASPAARIPRPSFVADVCASFQSAVVDVLVSKTILAAKRFKVNRVVVGGGVSANSELRRRMMREGRDNGLKVHFPSVSLCTDNAAMVASVGYYKLRMLNVRGDRSGDVQSSDQQSGIYSLKYSLKVDPALPIKNW